MHPAVCLIAENVLKNQHLFVPLILFALSTIATVDSPVQHSLLVTAVSWALIWIPTVFRAGIWSGGGSKSRKVTSWSAGGFLALAAICDRAACDQEGTWSTKGVLPLLVVLISENDFVSKHFALPSYTTLEDTTSDGTPTSERRSHVSSFRLLAVITIAASAALASRYTTSTTSALGLSSAIFTATGLVLFHNALKASKDDGDTRRGVMSAHGTFSRRSSGGAQKEQQLASLRDIAMVIMVVCGLVTYLVEPKITPHTISWEPGYRGLRGDWKTFHYHNTVSRCLLTIPVNVLANSLLFFMLSQQGAVHTSFLYLFAYIFARLTMDSSFSRIWFTVICGAAALLFLCNFTSTSTIDIRSSIRYRRLIIGVTTFSFGLLLLRHILEPQNYSLTTNDGPILNTLSPEAPLAPITLDLTRGHPADQLIREAEKDFQNLINRQSKSLSEAVQEYRRRHGIAPPPHFDKWYEFATRNGVQLIDEYDTITELMLPFWAVKPSTTRARVKLALGNEENALIGMMIRDGSVVKIENGQEWQQQATTGMMKDFVQYLPDMDLGFNIHDEPRVVVPNDQLSLLVAKARDEIIPAAMKNHSPRNSFSPRPSDMNDGKRFDEAHISRFNRFAHQQTWTHARLSCPMNTPARVYEDNAADNLTTYAAGPLNHIYNHTAFSDICNSPSFASTYGFFERPNAFNIIHELTPIFSQSKLSSFQDILYPSPWYWFGKVGYDLDRDTTWENKTNSLYWRGSTTGGFSRNGGWRRQHRQHVVKRLNAGDKAKILANTATAGSSPEYEVREVERRDLDSLIDVAFSHIGQCDPGDCDAQKEFFRVTERVDGQDAWYYKHLLDMDGNAFSGRFYAFLKSRSLVYKMAIFREWHQEWLRPWVHYVPLSLNGTEHLDLVRWFGGSGEEEVGGEGMKKEGGGGGKEKSREEEDSKGGNADSVGEKKAREIAERSTEWAGKVLRNVDFEAWFFRLLLEYGRIIDDNRMDIGYPGP